MTSHSNVPFVDLVTLHREMRDELTSVMDEVLRTASFIGGPMLEGFEEDFGRYCDSKFCVGVSSGTDALRFALIGAGVKPGETVVTVPNTFIATTEAISQAGARFDFVDVDERTLNLDPGKLEEYLLDRCYIDRHTGRISSRRTGSPVTAVVPVHLYGQTADMDSILELAERYRLLVIEDACQAHGAEYFSAKENRWRKAGSMGVAAAFSFYPAKNLGALGEGGAITTDCELIATTSRKLRQHGELKRYHHEMEGYNGRMDGLQAGFLRAKLKYLPEWVEMRRAAAKRYGDLLASLQGRVLPPHEPSWAKPAWHLYVVRVENRDELQKQLASAGIGTGIHYPVPLHLQDAYGSHNFKQGDFPVAERAAAEILSIPMYPQLNFSLQREVVQALHRFLIQDTMREDPVPAGTSSPRAPIQ